LIRIAHISDSHFDERGRLDDIIAVHSVFLEQAARADAHLIVHAGDWFERKSSPRERLAVANFLAEASRQSLPLVGVKGNHDAELDLDLFNELRPDMDSADAEPLALIVNPGFVRVGHGRIVVLGIPWFDKANIVSGLSLQADQEAGRVATMAAASDFLAGLRAQVAMLRAEDNVVVGVGHLLVAGSECSNGQTLIGTTVEIAPHDLLELGASYVALGHIHKAQEWFGGRVAYSGSPHRCNYGEPEAKGWRLVTLEDDGMFVSNEFRELPARKMVFIDMAGIKDEAGVVKRDDVEGALVRVRIRVSSNEVGQVDAQQIKDLLLAAGAYEAKVEVIVDAQTAARSPEIVQAKTIEEKAFAYFQAKGVDLDEAQAERIRTKLAQLQAD
jgi:exonuclease SbcD